MTEKIYENLINIFDECCNIDDSTLNLDSLSQNVLEFFENSLEFTSFQRLKNILQCDLNQKTTKDVFSKFIDPFINEMIDHGKYNIIPKISINLIKYMDQIRHNLQIRGIDLNIMIVGRSGSGKSSLLNSLFHSIVARNQISSSDIKTAHDISEKCEIKSIKHVINDDGIKLKISLYDTVGFGDLIDNSGCYDIPLKKINAQYHSYHENERSGSITFDQRIHCCIYVIYPTGHSLSSLDTICLKNLSEIVNVIPVIGRSDSLETSDLEAFRKRVREKIETENIICYPMKKYKVLAKNTPDEDSNIVAKLPLIWISGNHYNEKSKSYIRRTSFGDININDSTMCDNEILRDLLIRKNLLNILQTTEHIYYAKYRENI